MSDRDTQVDDDDPHAADDLQFVACADQVEEVERIIVNIGKREVGVFNLDGEWHALANICPHQGVPLCEGGIRGTLSAVRDEEGDNFDLVYDRNIGLLPVPGMPGSSMALPANIYQTQDTGCQHTTWLYAMGRSI